MPKNVVGPPKLGAVLLMYILRSHAGMTTPLDCGSRPTRWSSGMPITGGSQRPCTALPPMDSPPGAGVEWSKLTLHSSLYWSLDTM